MVAPFTVLIGRLLNAPMLGRLLFRRTGYSVPANFAVPAGTIRFCRFREFDTSIGDRRFAYSSSRFRSTMIWRFLPPNGYDTVAPCTVASGVRMKLFPRSKISCSVSVWLLNPSWRIGTLAASYFRTCGGNVPGGMLRTWTWHCVTICDSARSTSTVGWKNTRTTATL